MDGKQNLRQDIYQTKRQTKEGRVTFTSVEETVAYAHKLGFNTSAPLGTTLFSTRLFSTALLSTTLLVMVPNHHPPSINAFPPILLLISFTTLYPLLLPGWDNSQPLGRIIAPYPSEANLRESILYSMDDNGSGSKAQGTAKGADAVDGVDGDSRMDIEEGEGAGGGEGEGGQGSVADAFNISDDVLSLALKGGVDADTIKALLLSMPAGNVKYIIHVYEVYHSCL
jgi:hypothetical protein